MLTSAAAFGVMAVALAMVLTPGPNMMYLVSRKLAGACYLGWLAFKALRPGGISIFAPARLSHDSPRRLFTMGLMTALLNPKIAVMYLSLIPQFEKPARGHLALQGFTLGALQILVSLTVNLCIVLAAGTIAGILSGRPGWVRAQRYLMGTVLGGLAVKLLTDHARPSTT